MARMLVIDDEESIRKLLSTVLKRKGHEVFLADSGQKGINMFERTHPLVTILDLRLPDVNGIEVLSRLRAIDPQACVIMMTGFATGEAEAKALALGADDFLQKGFSLFELGEALRRAMASMSKDPVLAAAVGSRIHNGGGADAGK
ncbi:MAG: response regulator [Nitrospiraceae bacterium]|nr:response regulator [Nitrospiraceae bacterium]